MKFRKGFLVSGFLIPLIVPVDTPLWMVAVATAFAVIFAKEVFGGTGMNIFNVALVTRAFLCLSNLHVGRCGLGAYRINIRNGSRFGCGWLLGCYCSRTGVYGNYSKRSISRYCGNPIGFIDGFLD